MQIISHTARETSDSESGDGVGTQPGLSTLGAGGSIPPVSTSQMPAWRKQQTRTIWDRVSLDGLAGATPAAGTFS